MKDKKGPIYFYSIHYYQVSNGGKCKIVINQSTENFLVCRDVSTISLHITHRERRDQLSVCVKGRYGEEYFGSFRKFGVRRFS